MFRIPYYDRVLDINPASRLVITHGNGIRTNIVWIPGHAGIVGNETADVGARIATTRDQVDIIIPASMTDAKSRIRKYIDDEWQQQWSLSTKGCHYRGLEPTISRKVKFSCSNRKRETIQTRLRLGKCWLNDYLKVIGRHADGNCVRCKKPETIEHFIMECVLNSDLISEIKNSCMNQKIPMNITTILKNNETMEKITDYIIKNGRKI